MEELYRKIMKDIDNGLEYPSQELKDYILNIDDEDLNNELTEPDYLKIGALAKIKYNKEIKNLFLRRKKKLWDKD